jgi:hypothetical protein
VLQARDEMNTLHAFAIPEDDALLPAWLESMIAGPHLGELVSELEVLQAPDPSARRNVNLQFADEHMTLDKILGNRLSQVYDRGLGVVSSTALRRLFRYPHLLFELQTHVLAEGGAYWDQKLRESTELTEMADAGWSHLTQALKTDDANVLAERAARIHTDKSPTRPIRWFVAGMLSAAAVAVVVVVMRDRMHGPQHVAGAGWGWNRPDAFAADVSREDYLNALADGAQEWHRERPDTPQALARRITEFREGCSRLILADHRPLAPPDSSWLVDRCRTWAKKLDEHLVDIEAGKDLDTVRSQVDATVARLVQVLRDRAAHPAAA